MNRCAHAVCVLTCTKLKIKQNQTCPSREAIRRAHNYIIITPRVRRTSCVSDEKQIINIPAVYVYIYIYYTSSIFFWWKLKNRFVRFRQATSSLARVESITLSRTLTLTTRHCTASPPPRKISSWNDVKSVYQSRCVYCIPCTRYTNVQTNYRFFSWQRPRLWKCLCQSVQCPSAVINVVVVRNALPRYIIMYALQTIFLEDPRNACNRIKIILSLCGVIKKTKNITLAPSPVQLTVHSARVGPGYYIIAFPGKCLKTALIK